MSKRDYMTKKEIAFCEECNDDVEFEIEEVCFDAEIRGTKFKAQRLRAKCKKCGEIVYPVSLEKKNQILLYDAYKKSLESKRNN